MAQEAVEATSLNVIRPESQLGSGTEPVDAEDIGMVLKESCDVDESGSVSERAVAGRVHETLRQRGALHCGTEAVALAGWLRVSGLRGHAAQRV